MNIGVAIGGGKAFAVPVLLVLAACMLAVFGADQLLKKQ
jgi:hypothetical protein